MVNRIVIVEPGSDWAADQITYAVRATLPQVIAGLAAGSYVVTNTVTSDPVTVTGSSEFTFQQFSLTNGSEGQWVGYSTGAPTTPQPAFGSISAQPTTEATLLAFYDDTASGVVLAVFSGDHAAALDGLEVSVQGRILSAFETEVISGNTWVRFSGVQGNWVLGTVYPVQFGWDLANETIGGVPMGAAGGAGTIYSGYTLAAGDDLSQLPSIWTANNPGGKYRMASVSRGRDWNNLGSSRQMYVYPEWWGYAEGEFYKPRGLQTLELTGSGIAIVASLAAAGDRQYFDPNQTIVQDYISASLNTAEWMQFRYGVIEWRARVPLGNAQWPAVWTLSPNPLWPAQTEWGFEFFGDGSHQEYFIWPNGSGGSFVEHTDHSDIDITQWHLYSVVWFDDLGTPTLQYYVDGVLHFTRTANVGLSSETRYAIMNNAVSTDWNGGQAEGNVTAGQFPSRMEIDFLRYWAPATQAAVNPVANSISVTATEGAALEIDVPQFFDGATAESVYAAWDNVLTPGTGSPTAPGLKVLPDGMAWNAGTRKLTWTSPVGNGRLCVRFTGYKTAGGLAAIRYVYINLAPKMKSGGSIPAQAPAAGAAWQYRVPLENVFAFGNVAPTSITCTLANGAALPSWLTWSQSNRLLSGTPPTGASVTVRFTASNAIGSLSYDLAIAASSAVVRGPVVMEDAFSGLATDASLAGRLTTTGSYLWTVTGTMLGNSAFKAVRASVVPARARTAYSAKNVYANASWTFRSKVTGQGGGLLLRYVDENNYLAFGFTSMGTAGQEGLNLVQVIGGTATVLWNMPMTFNLSQTYKFSAEVNETTIKVFLDDVEVHSREVALNVAGFVGIRGIGVASGPSNGSLCYVVNAGEMVAA